MSGSHYDRMGVKEFGAQLLTTRDLDPIYVMLWEAGLEPGLLKRWLLAYWCYYHAGTASAIAEAPRFWEAMRAADDNHWPRGTERRHFRGFTASNSMKQLEVRYTTPEAAVDHVAELRTFEDVAERVQTWYGFGPWIAFKVADMLERVMGVPVDFSNSVLSFYKEPAAAAGLMGLSLTEAVEMLLEEFKGQQAPPRFDRPVGVQEVETIMCKWKSHMGGHYPPGKDTLEIAHGLEGWGPLAKRLSTCLPT